MQLSLRGEALDSAVFLPVFGITPPFAGQGEIDLDLRGQGADTQAWAASSVGHIGFALTDGRMQQRLLATLLPRDSQRPATEIAIACFAARFDVVAGIAQVRALYADGSLGRINGQGQISLRDESLALRQAVAECDAFALTALGNVVPPLGSLVLGLAFVRGEIDAAEAFRISLVDETFQEEFWGVDEEAQKRRRLIAAEITLADRMLHLARSAA